MVDNELPASGHSYWGQLSTVQEAHAILEASRQGLLPRVTRRLTDDERVRFVRPGAIFVWEEEEAGIRRWTDHIKWSPSRVSGAFLTYTEVPARGDDTLIKQSFSSVDARGTKMHLIAYTTKTAHASGVLPSAAADPLLQPLLHRRVVDPRQRPPSDTSSTPGPSRPSTAQRSPAYSNRPSLPSPQPSQFPHTLYRHPSTPHFPSAVGEAYSVALDSRPRPSSAVEGSHHRPLSSSSAAEFARPLSSYASFSPPSSFPHSTFEPTPWSAGPPPSKQWQFAYSAPSASEGINAPSPMDIDPRSRPTTSAHPYSPPPFSPPIDPYTRQLPPLNFIASGLPTVAGGVSPELPAAEDTQRRPVDGSDSSEEGGWGSGSGGLPGRKKERTRGTEDERQLRLLDGPY